MNRRQALLNAISSTSQERRVNGVITGMRDERAAMPREFVRPPAAAGAAPSAPRPGADEPRARRGPRAEEKTDAQDDGPRLQRPQRRVPGDNSAVDAVMKGVSSSSRSRKGADGQRHADSASSPAPTEAAASGMNEECSVADRVMAERRDPDVQCDTWRRTAATLLTDSTPQRRRCRR